MFAWLFPKVNSLYVKLPIVWYIFLTPKRQTWPELTFFHKKTDLEEKKRKEKKTDLGWQSFYIRESRERPPTKRSIRADYNLSLLYH